VGIKLNDLPIHLREQALRQMAKNYRDKTYPRNQGMVPAHTERKPALARQHAPEARGLGASVVRPRVRIIMYRCGKSLDRDNMWGAPKAILDGLSQVNFIRGDSESEIDYHVEQIRVAHRSGIRTVIEIEES
jgi:hypothetical protein